MPQFDILSFFQVHGRHDSFSMQTEEEWMEKWVVGDRESGGLEKEETGRGKEGEVW